MSTKTEKAAERVAREIVQTIYEDGLRPGDHYLSEADALVRHNVSRATFREALRFLEFQGVIRVRAGPGGGAMVQKPEWPHLSSTFALLLQFADASLADVMAARTALEPSMVALAARNATPEQVAELLRLVGEARRSLADAGSFIMAYRSFWGQLARATGNAVTAMLWPALRALIDSGQFTPNEQYRRRLVGWMGDLVELVATHDVAGAQEMMQMLDHKFNRRLRRYYPERFGRTLAWRDVRSETAGSTI